MSKLFSWFGKNKAKDQTPTESQADKDTAQIDVPVDREEANIEAKPDSPIEQQDPTPAPTTEGVDQSDVDKPQTQIDVPESRQQATPELTPEHAQPARAAEMPAESAPETTSDSPPEPAKVVKTSLFERLKRGLSKTSENIGSGFISLFSGKKIDDELFEELETQLLVADVGMDTTQKIISNLTDNAKRSELKDGDALYGVLKNQLKSLLEPVSQPLQLDQKNTPYVILMVGVNGVGKTTTIGKMAKQFQAQGKKVMLAAGDTFRAAAVEQLQVWGERNQIPVIAQHTGADSASVLFDALQAAKARQADVLIADTAGRLQNKDHLMEELKKVVRVMKKLDPDAPHEVMLALDAGTGQNAMSQCKIFSDAVGLTGITLTKLDGTAKGGVIFAIADKFGIPIRYIGVGEGIDDLRQFDSSDFVDALFDQPQGE